jgi:hypothetical protein
MESVLHWGSKAVGDGQPDVENRGGVEASVYLSQVLEWWNDFPANLIQNFFGPIRRRRFFG